MYISFKLTGGGEDRVRINSDESHYQDSSFSELMLLKTMRVYYAITPPGLHPPPFPVTLTSKCFVPVRMGSNETETLTSLVERMNSWINATGEH